MGQSEVVSCLSGFTHSSGGICSFQVKCAKDSFRDDEQTKFLAKLDNTRSRQNVNKIEVKLVRTIRLNTQPIGINQGSSSSIGSYDSSFTQDLYTTTFAGIPGRSRDSAFSREFPLNLEEIFFQQAGSSPVAHSSRRGSLKKE